MLCLIISPYYIITLCSSLNATVNRDHSSGRTLHLQVYSRAVSDLNLIPEPNQVVLSHTRSGWAGSILYIFVMPDYKSIQHNNICSSLNASVYRDHASARTLHLQVYSRAVSDLNRIPEPNQVVLSHAPCDKNLGILRATRNCMRQKYRAGTFVAWSRVRQIVRP